MKVNKKLLIVIISSIIMVIAIILIIILKESTHEIKETYVVTCEIRDKQDIWEVRVEYPAGKKYLYKNGEKQELLQVLGIKEAKPCMKLPDVQGNGSNIEDKKSSQLITWTSDLNKCSEYIKYLTNNGYKELRYAATQGYIEIFLQNGDTTKRVIISNSNIMIANVLTDKLPDIKNYYQ